MPAWLDRWTEKRMAKARAIIAEAEAAGHPTGMPDLGAMVDHVREGVRDAVGDMYDDRRDVVTPPPGADFKRRHEKRVRPPFRELRPAGPVGAG